MKVTAVLIPFLLSTASLSPVKNSYQLPSKINNSISINACIHQNLTLNSLSLTELEKKLAEIEQEKQKISISIDPAMRCALKISKNNTTGKFNFDYNSIPVISCSNQNSVICNTNSNCSTALKCCDQPLPCTNAMKIKQISMAQLYNLTGEICNFSNQTSCYIIEQLNASIYYLPTEKNDGASLLAVNPVVYFYITLINTFIYLNLIK
jgi:hypothetical protein